MRFFPELADHLAEEGVRYVVVGGLAVVLRGHQRMTGDVDIALAMDSENLRKAVGVFRDKGLVPRANVRLEDFADEEIRRSWMEDKGLRGFGLFKPSDPTTILDIILDEDLNFEDLESSATLLPLGRSTVPVASIRHLIAMKEKAGRDKDLHDIEALRVIENG